MGAGKLSRILPAVLARITPSAAQRSAEASFTRALIARVRTALPRGARAALAGSMAKGTWLPDARDVDIFVLFSRGKPRDMLEAEIKRIMARAFPRLGYQLSYAEHPYARFHLEGRRVDLVPAYGIRHAGQRLSAVDRSVLHAKYVLSSLGARQRGEVLLLKKFLKASGLYGAEIRVGGFSGYLCELLIIECGSFAALLRSARSWVPPLLLDPARFCKDKKAKAQALAGFAPSALAVPDPTDRGRNVAAALSSENLKRFAALSRRFLKSPSQDFFFRAPPPFEARLAALKKRGTAFVISMPKPDSVDDVLWGQLRKLTGQLEARLRRDGFEALRPGMLADDSGGTVRIAFAVRRALLPPKMEREGPALGMGKHVHKFRAHHAGARFVKRKGRLYAVVRRTVRKPEASLCAFFSELHSRGSSHLAYPLPKIRISRI